jgi:hypothetical protein
MNITVTVGFNADALQVLNRLLSSLNGEPGEKLTPPVSNNTKSSAKSIVKEVKEVDNGHAAPTVTLEDLRKIFTEKGKASEANKAKCRELLIKYASKSVSNIPEDKYAEVYDEIKAI